MGATTPAKMNAPAISPLFVPAGRPELIDKARASTADAVIVDLEDAVGPQDKDRARDQLANYAVRHPDAALFVRINAIDTAFAAADLALVAESPAITGVMLPKTESAEMVDWASQPGKPLWALVETPAGVLALDAIAGCSRPIRLAFGALDLAAALGVDAEHAAGAAVLDQARAALVLHSAACGLAPPLDSPVPDFRNSEPAQWAAERAVAMGFGGMLAIHPTQVDVIRAAFTPSAEACDWAARVVEASQASSGAVQIDGQMVDAPVVERARRLLARARRLAG